MTRVAECDRVASRSPGKCLHEKSRCVFLGCRGNNSRHDLLRRDHEECMPDGFHDSCGRDDRVVATRPPGLVLAANKDQPRVATAVSVAVQQGNVFARLEDQTHTKERSCSR